MTRQSLRSDHLNQREYESEDGFGRKPQPLCESREHQIDLWEKESFRTAGPLCGWRNGAPTLFPTAVFPSKRIWEGEALRERHSGPPNRAPGGRAHLPLWQDSLTTLLRMWGPGVQQASKDRNKQQKRFF